MTPEGVSLGFEGALRVRRLERWQGAGGGTTAAVSYASLRAARTLARTLLPPERVAVAQSPAGPSEEGTGCRAVAVALPAKEPKEEEGKLQLACGAVTAPRHRRSPPHGRSPPPPRRGPPARAGFRRRSRLAALRCRPRRPRWAWCNASPSARCTCPAPTRRRSGSAARRTAARCRVARGHSAAAPCLDGQRRRHRRPWRRLARAPRAGG